MMEKIRTVFTESVLLASMIAVLIVALDLTFCAICPKSFWGFMPYPIPSVLTILTIDGIVTFIFSLSVLLIQILTGRAIAFLALFLLASLYLINWATYLIVGEFLGLEGLRFAVYNFDQILWHMNQISRWYVLILISLILTPLGIFLFLCKTTIGKPKTPKQLGRIQTGLALAISVLMIGGYIALQTSFAKLPARIKIALISRTAPQLTLLFDRPRPEIAVQFQTGMKKLNFTWEQQIPWEQYFKKAGPLKTPTPVIMIVIESLRTNFLDLATVMPNLHELSGDALLLNSYTPSNVTDYAWPSIFSSQYPVRSPYHYYYSRRADYPRVTVFDIVKRWGYKTALFSAQNEEWCGMINAFNKDSLDALLSAELAGAAGQYVSAEDSAFASFAKQFKAAGKLDDSIVIDKAIEWLSAAPGQKFFVGINFQRTHFPYTWPDSFRPPFPHGEKQRWFYPINQLDNMRGRYFNALRYIDDQIGRLIKFLKVQGLYDRSLIVITGDHGESFHEHGSTAHGNSLYNETALTPVFFKLPKGDLRPVLKNPPELIDLAPSILDVLGLPRHGAFQGQSLFAQPLKLKPVFITVHSPIAQQDAIVLNNKKLIWDHRNGVILLFDLARDPGETRNLTQTLPSETNQLLFLLMSWRSEQLKYYADPSKEKHFYPPTFSLQ